MVASTVVKMAAKWVDRMVEMLVAVTVDWWVEMKAETMVGTTVASWDGT